MKSPPVEYRIRCGACNETKPERLGRPLVWSKADPSSEDWICHQCIIKAVVSNRAGLTASEICNFIQNQTKELTLVEPHAKTKD
jgi:hypothetical protein